MSIKEIALFASLLDLSIDNIVNFVRTRLGEEYASAQSWKVCSTKEMAMHLAKVNVFSNLRSRSIFQ